MAGINTLGVIAFNNATIATIAAGVLTFTQAMHYVAAESSTSDDLDTLTADASLTLAGNGYSFRPLLLLQADSGDTITIKHGTGNILTPSGTDVTLAGDGIVLLAQFGTSWHLLGATSGGGGGGSVTSVGLSTDAAWLSVSGSPVTTSGTIALNKATGLTANQVIATPDGTSGSPELRALVGDDIPTLTSAHTPTALHSDSAGEINALDEKTTPVDDDVLVIEDSADSYEKKRVKVGNLPSGSSMHDTIVIYNQVAQNTAQETYTANAYSNITPTLIADTGNHASIAGAVITLTAGTYLLNSNILLTATGGTWGAFLEIYDDSNNTRLARSIGGSIATGQRVNVALVGAMITLSATTDILWRVYMDGFGSANTGALNVAGESEIYAQLNLVKIA